MDATPAGDGSATEAAAAFEPDWAVWRFLDPYFVWALQTHFRAFKRRQVQAPGDMTFLVELFKPYEAKLFENFVDAKVSSSRQVWLGNPLAIGKRRISLNGQEAWVPLAYGQPLPSGDTPRFITLRVPTGFLQPTPDAGWEQVLYQLARSLALMPAVKRIQIGFQRPGFDLALADEVTTPPDSLPQEAPVTPKLVLGVLEDAFPFGHAALRTAAGITRVKGFWDQSLVTQAVLPWKVPASFPYGRILKPEDLQALLERYRGPPENGGEVDEEALYNAPELAMYALRGRASHAAAVLDLLTGATPPLGRGVPDDGLPASAQQPPPPPQPHLADDSPVRSAPVVVVQMPREQTTISAGRWLAVNALDGMHFVIGAAQALAQANDPPPPLVVNLSYGCIAGPHDGGSLLDAALDELCLAYPNLALVLAAGNAHGAVQRSEAAGPGDTLPGGVHAQRTLPPGESARFTLLAPADKPFETYLELWFSVVGGASTGDPWLGPDEVEITVQGPDGSPEFKPVKPGAWYFPPGPPAPPGGPQDAGTRTIAGLVFARRPSQSLTRSMALMVLAATQVHPDFVEAPAGCWTVTVRNLLGPRDSGARTLDVQAWVERDDIVFGVDRPQSARLLPDDALNDTPLSDANTFSNLANSQASLAVGALVQAGPDPDQWPVSRYSAAGPDKQHGPAMSALGDASRALGGIRTAGSQSGAVLRTNGTSMAAPQAARWVAHELASPRTLADIKRELAGAPERDARRGFTVPRPPKPDAPTA